MPFKSWKQIEALLATATAPVSDEQKKLGSYLGDRASRSNT